MNVTHAFDSYPTPARLVLSILRELGEGIPAKLSYPIFLSLPRCSRSSFTWAGVKLLFNALLKKLSKLLTTFFNALVPSPCSSANSAIWDMNLEPSFGETRNENTMSNSWQNGFSSNLLSDLISVYIWSSGGTFVKWNELILDSKYLAWFTRRLNARMKIWSSVTEPVKGLRQHIRMVSKRKTWSLSSDSYMWEKRSIAWFY